MKRLSLSRAEVDLALGEQRALALVALTFALPGSLYLYQGEELGLPEVFDIADDRREDPVFKRTNGAEIGRDGCRIPLPWTNDQASSYGFSVPREDGTVGAAWLPQPKGWGDLSMANAEATKHSALSIYRSLGEVRAAHAVNQELAAKPVEFGAGLVGLRRGSLVVVVNATMDPIELDMNHEDLSGTDLVFSSQPDEESTTSIPANSTMWFVDPR